MMACLRARLLGGFPFQHWRAVFGCGFYFPTPGWRYPFFRKAVPESMAQRRIFSGIRRLLLSSTMPYLCNRGGFPYLSIGARYLAERFTFRRWTGVVRSLQGPRAKALLKGGRSNVNDL